MKKLLLAAMAVFVMGGFPAVAGPPDGLWETLSKTQRDTSSNRGWGNALGVVAGNTTFATADWGFTSNYVTLCVIAGLAAGDHVYYRLGATDPGTNATDSAAFISGATDLTPGRALVLSGSGDGTDKHCETHPYRTDGLIFHASSVSATVDVSAY